MENVIFKYALCTLFDSNYLDKGLVLYDSLLQHASSFTFYVLAMDDKCYEVLMDLNYDKLIPIKLSDFENDDLLRVKKIRSVAEYCWTCGSSLIKYVFEKYKPDYCSYIDADMAFYDDPYLLIEELNQRNASVSIIGHRFPWYNRKSESRRVGKYCVECNTFKNENNAQKLLDLWISQCINHCSIDGDGVYWADQKYLDNWVDDYDFVIETEMMGAGVAPWNISQYKLSKFSHDGEVLLKYKGCRTKLFFFHFENIKFISNNRINIDVYNAWGIDKKLVSCLYNSYLCEILKKKEMLKQTYDINVVIRNHPGLVPSRKTTWSISRLIKYAIVDRKKSSLFFTIIPSLINRKHNIFLFD